MKLRVGLSGPSLFLNSVWVYCSHLIASSIPVELAGGALMLNFPLGYHFGRGESSLWLSNNNMIFDPETKIVFSLA